ncbi:MAG: glycosyltransferase [Acidobacteriota bacterium]
MNGERRFTLLHQMNINPPQKKILLLDLSGNEGLASHWAIHRFPHGDIQALNKADLKWQSKGAALKQIRAIKAHTFAIFTNDLDLQSQQGAMMLFGALAGAKRIVFGDARGRLVERSQLGAFLIETPRLVLEFAFAYLFIIPLSWLITAVLSFLFKSKKARKIRIKKRSDKLTERENPSTALYLRATLAGAKEGGMVTHVAGFSGGVQALGHKLIFLISGDDAPQPNLSQPTIAIKPTATVNATRAIFELWNNLVFTWQSVVWLMTTNNHLAQIDFIYQRYNRFNWTGAALAAITGLPLVLEFNGSEVWASQSWDPVGQLNLLQRFESLNLEAADFIFTVSAVERRNLTKQKVDAGKIFANPNGVDTDSFHPDAGGAAIRQRFGIDDKIVIGFVGTFGPWHGAEVLAEAATQIKANCHFLFIGDGDGRAACEARFAHDKARATFIGRVAHHQVASYLDACDILVSPHVPASDGSEFFGSPTKLFEYLAMEKPVVASRLGQIAEVIQNQTNGLLVEPGNVNELTQAIERLAGDEGLRKRLGEAARQTVIQKFTWKQNAARVFNAVYGLQLGDQ